MNIGDTVNIHSLGTGLKDGRGKIVDILKAGIKYPEWMIHKYYQFSSDKYKASNFQMITVDRLIIQRNGNTDNFIVWPVSPRSRGHITLS